MDKYIQAIVNTAQSIYDGAVVMCERYGYSDSVIGSEIDKLFGLELLCVWLGNRELDEKISLMREKLRDMKNNKPGGADEGQPVKGDTAKDGGRECCTCGKLYPFMCECGGF